MGTKICDLPEPLCHETGTVCVLIAEVEGSVGLDVAVAARVHLHHADGSDVVVRDLLVLGEAPAIRVRPQGVEAEGMVAAGKCRLESNVRVGARGLVRDAGDLKVGIERMTGADRGSNIDDRQAH